MNAGSVKREGGGGNSLGGDGHRLLNAQEIADFLGISPYTVQAHWKSGALASVKLGPDKRGVPRRSSLDQVRSFIDAHTEA